MSPGESVSSGRVTTRILRAATEEQWVSWAANEFVAVATSAVRRSGSFHVVVPGGSTPRTVLERISDEYAAGFWAGGPEAAGVPPRLSVDGADQRLEDVWRATHVYFGDERGVGPDHPDSNYRMVREAWLDRIPVPDAQVHRIRGELELEDAATAYGAVVADLLGEPAEGKSGSVFHLVVLGLGPDGHTASLIPGVDLDFVSEPWAGVGPAPLSPAQVRRVTLTAAALRRTERSVFWVKGEAKAEVVGAALTGTGMRTMVPEVLPRSGEVSWLLDLGATSRLDQSGDQALFRSSSRISERI